MTKPNDLNPTPPPSVPQTVKHIMFRLGVGTDLSSGVLSGADADMHLSKYRAEGWEIKHVQSFGTDLTSVNMLYVLIKK